ncbi:hypothetical protein MTO96_008989 [Rhipicephalus appendiculatus]
MPYEGRKTTSFYSSTNYLSPLERKRLRAIENEPQATEITADQTPNKRSSKKSSPKRRDNASKKTQPPGKRKRSVSGFREDCQGEAFPATTTRLDPQGFFGGF